MKQLHKSLKVIFCKMIDASAIPRPDFFTGNAKRIFICDQKIGKIILPQIFIKTIIGCNDQNPFDLLINTGDQLILVVSVALYLLADIRKLHQDTVLWQISIYDQF